MCDTDPTVLDARVNKVADKQKIEVKGYADMREMFEKGDIDAMSTATLEPLAHRGGLGDSGGKDAYVEKPISHNVWEGRQLVKLARKEGKICQGGTQSRSLGSIQAAVKFVQEGNLGKSSTSRACATSPVQSIGTRGGGTIPEGVNYDLWCGPAELESPLRRKKFHYDWHWFYAYGNGDMGNQGIHQMDVARWYLGENTIAPRSMSIGGRLGYDDDGETPNTQVVYHDYDAAPLIFETRGLPKSKESQEKDWGKSMESARRISRHERRLRRRRLRRWFCLHRCRWQGEDQGSRRQGNARSGAFKTDDIFENFINAVKSRKVEEKMPDAKRPTSPALFVTPVYLAPSRRGPEEGRDPREDQGRRPSSPSASAQWPTISPQTESIWLKTVCRRTDGEVQSGDGVGRRQRRARCPGEYPRDPRIPEALHGARGALRQQTFAFEIGKAVEVYRPSPLFCFDVLAKTR